MHFKIRGAAKTQPFLSAARIPQTGFFTYYAGNSNSFKQVDRIRTSHSELVRSRPAHDSALLRGAECVDLTLAREAMVAQGRKGKYVEDESGCLRSLALWTRSILETEPLRHGFTDGSRQSYCSDKSTASHLFIIIIMTKVEVDTAMITGVFWSSYSCFLSPSRSSQYPHTLLQKNTCLMVSSIILAPSK